MSTIILNIYVAVLSMGVVETKYWHKIDDGRIQCDICPRACRMREGQRGLCSVRGVVDEEVVLLSYGDASGFCIDPIEKKPLNHFLPGTPILSFGQTGCNLTCSFCQNHSISKHKSDGLDQRMRDMKKIPSDIYKTFTNEKNDNSDNENNGLIGCSVSQNYDISKSREFDKLAQQASPEMIADAAVKTGARSVAFTYNDPVIFLEYAIDVARACHERGVKTVAVTAGYICPEPRKEFFAHMDAANVDLKCFTESFYEKLCTAQLGAVLDTLKYLKHETNVWFEITTLLIPDENDSDTELDALSAWIAEELGPDVPLHFSAFHPDWKMMDKPRTPASTLKRARDIAIKNGLNYVYMGNVHDKSGSSTYCSACNHMLIGRDWYELSDWDVRMGGNREGRCIKCSEPVAGVFDGPPGDWGRKRMPLKFRQSGQ